MGRWMTVDQAFKDAGVFAAGEALEPSSTATRVRVRGGKTETMDGPFAETKEQLGGYYALDCEDLDAAIKYAAMLPVEDTGTLEDRPVMDLANLPSGLEGYQSFHAARADMLDRLGQVRAARIAYDRALALTGNRADRPLLTRKRDALGTLSGEVVGQVGPGESCGHRSKRPKRTPNL